MVREPGRKPVLRKKVDDFGGKMLPVYSPTRRVGRLKWGIFDLMENRVVVERPVLKGVSVDETGEPSVKTKV